jgi:hypothetical protein
VTHDGVGGKQAPELMMQAHVVVLFLRKQLVFLSPFINLNHGRRNYKDTLNVGFTGV